MKDSEKHIIKSSMKMSVVTMVSRVFGLVRDQLQAIFLGTTYLSDAFNIAFMLPNLLRRLSAEGAMTVSFVPIFTEIEENRGRADAQRLFSSFFTFLSIILVVITILGIIFSTDLIGLLMSSGDKAYDPEKLASAMKLMTNLTRIMFPYILLISLAALVQGVLNIHHNYTVPAFTPVLMNISIISIVLFFNFIAPGVFPNITYAFAAGVMLGGLLQFLYQLPSFFRLGYRIRISFHFRDSALARIGKLFVPGIFGVSVYQINVLISYYFAASLGEGRVSALTFSSRLNELSLGIFAVSLSTVMLSTLSREVLAENKDRFIESISYSLRLLALIMIPAAAGSFVLSEDIVSLIFKFGRFDSSSVNLTSASFRYLSLGLFFIGGYRVIAQSFYSLKDTRTPVIASFLAMLINALLCYLLPACLKLDITGIALANTVSNTFMFLLLFFILQVRLKKGLVRQWSMLLRTLLASVVMGAAAWFGHSLFLEGANKLQLLWRLPCLITLCIMIYVGVNLLLGNSDLGTIASAVRKKLFGAGGSGR